MAFLDEIFNGLIPLPTGRIPEGIDMRLVVAPAVEPVSLNDFKVAMRVPLTFTQHDASITRLLKSSRLTLESYIHICFITQQWEQCHNAVGRQIALLRKPCTSLDAIEIIPNFDADARVAIDPSLWIKSGVNVGPYQEGLVPPAYVLVRRVWPSHRSWKSFFLTFKAGFGPSASDVPANIKEAIIALAGHYYENPEGEGESGSRYAIRAFGAIPSDIHTKLEMYMDWSLA